MDWSKKERHLHLIQPQTYSKRNHAVKWRAAVGKLQCRDPNTVDVQSGGETPHVLKDILGRHPRQKGRVLRIRMTRMWAALAIIRGKVSNQHVSVNSSIMNCLAKRNLQDHDEKLTHHDHGKKHISRARADLHRRGQ